MKRPQESARKTSESNIRMELREVKWEDSSGREMFTGNLCYQQWDFFFETNEMGRACGAYGGG